MRIIIKANFQAIGCLSAASLKAALWPNWPKVWVGIIWLLFGCYHCAYVNVFGCQGTGQGSVPRIHRAELRPNLLVAQPIFGRIRLTDSRSGFWTSSGNQRISSVNQVRKRTEECDHSPFKCCNHMQSHMPWNEMEKGIFQEADECETD